jgi:PAS domain S-box-containing protein
MSPRQHRPQAPDAGPRTSGVPPNESAPAAPLSPASDNRRDSEWVRREADRRVAHILDRVTDAFIALDQEWRVRFMNREAERLHGRPADGVIGRSCWEEWPETVGTRVETEYRRAMAEQEPVHFEHHVQHQYGPDLWLDVHAYPSDEGLAVFQRDVSHLKRVEGERRRSEARYQALVTATAQIVWTTDAAGFVVAEEAGWELFTGEPFERYGGRGWLDAVHPDDREAAAAGWSAAVEAQQVYAASYRVRRRDGVYRHFAVRGVPVFNADGSVREWVGTHTDVTAQVEALAELEAKSVRLEEQRVALERTLRAREEAEAERERLLAAAERARADAESANRAKSEFLAMMSHELRTPLNAIAGYVQLLDMELRGPVTDAQRADLARIDSSQRHLLGVINDILNFARLDAGRLHYRLEPVDVAEALGALETLVGPQLQAKAIDYAFTCTGDGALPPRATADREKLQQVVLNLLSNAVKFTEHGGRVALECEVAGDRVVVRVRDNGRGIAADRLDDIFEPFVRVEREYTRSSEGTGLGLAIGRELSRGMGGDLTVESEVGAGSTFTLTLPRA